MGISGEVVKMRTLPYQWLLDNHWAIVGMNHYFVNGIRHLFCAIVRGNTCIRAEGTQDLQVFNDLIALAKEINK